jgi:hypothetical protein
MKEKQVLVDVRMIRNSGIGVYLASVLLLLKKESGFKLLIAAGDDYLFH